MTEQELQELQTEETSQSQETQAPELDVAQEAQPTETSVAQEEVVKEAVEEVDAQEEIVEEVDAQEEIEVAPSKAELKAAKKAAKKQAKAEKKAQKQAKKTSLAEKCFSLFSLKLTKVIIFFLGALALSAFVMFLMDDYNNIRERFFPWLSENLFGSLLQGLNVNRNLYEGGWLIFLTVCGGVLLFIILSSFRKAFVNALASKSAKKFKSEEKAKRFYNIVYFVVVGLLVAAYFVALFLLGVYDPLWSPREDGSVPPPAGEILLNLLYIIAVCTVFLFLVVLVVVFCMYLISFLFGWFAVRSQQAKSTLSKSADKVSEEGESGAENGEAGAGVGGVGAGVGVDSEHPLNVEINESVTVKEEPVPPAVLGKEIFPSLVRLDELYPEKEKVEQNAEMSLEEFVLQFQAYAISRKIYYELPMLRSFLAGLSAARLIILEGLSGTGKSMLPRMFCEFTGSKSFFAPVQATWRDKSDMLGYFSEFTKSFKSTDFLKNLYEASYTERVNLMVLDEMNISRIEYYFADFLSILEYPPEDWKVRVFEPVLGQELPNNLDDGYVQIPENTWFIGTANTDDSTFTITDKVYDRAIVLDFAEKFSPITSNYISDPIKIDHATLKKMFVAAQNDSSKGLSKTDEEKFAKVCDFVAESFDLRFGNRIMVQINNFVPVYVALGGTKEEALDFMFARKILRKLNGAFEDDVKDKLIALLKLLNATYGKGTFKATEKAINKILKRLV